MNESNETLAFLQSMKEDDLTRRVLIPLLGKLGYVDAVFHGGPHEEGKDLIVFRYEAFDKLTILVAQVKRFKSARSTATSVQWGKIVHQLRVAQSKAVACKDGQKRTPSEVAFITPYVIDVRMLEEQFEQVQLNDITIIDGAALYREIRRTWPTLLADIGNINAKIAAITKGALSNRELFESLKIADEVPYENIYSDLTFFVGRAETKELICSSIEYSEPPQQHSYNAWLSIKANLLEVERLVGFDLISSQIPEIENTYTKLRKRFLSEKNKALEFTLAEMTAGIESRAGAIFITIESLHRRYAEDKKLTPDPKEEEHELPAASMQFERTLRSIREFLRAGEFAAVISTLDRETINFLSENGIVNLREQLEELMDSGSRLGHLHARYVPEPTIRFALNCAKLCEYVTSQVHWLREVVSKLNSNSRSGMDVREFLRRVELLLSVVNRLVHTKTFGREVFRLKRERQFENRFAISAHEVFDTGLNIAVYGEAGAGKSTTLHIYVKRYSERARSDAQEALVFLPINRVMSAKATNGFNGERDLEREEFVRALLKCTLIYVGGEPSEPSVEEFLAWIKTRSRITFIIDGLDEAVTSNRWLLRAINAIPASFSNAQVIISSRDCISEINQIDFLGITLLPFTDCQLKRFIEGWNAESGPALWAAIKDQQLMEVAKNPLLATIVCSLHDHGIAIPANEPEVYRKYIALLCGQYDAFKQVKRTRTPQELLEKVARVIAFKMHRQHLREIDASDLSSLLRNTFQETVTGEALDVAAAELISPCDILKHIPNTRFVGFGHLRFQEFLASEEFYKNNRYSPLDYVNDEWWTGVLYLYAFSVDMEEFMANLYRTGRHFANSSGVLQRMIEARPAHERNSLRHQLEIWKEQELRDEISPPDEDIISRDWGEAPEGMDDEEESLENEFDFLREAAEEDEEQEDDL